MPLGNVPRFPWPASPLAQGPLARKGMGMMWSSDHLSVAVRIGVCIFPGLFCVACDSTPAVTPDEFETVVIYDASPWPEDGPYPPLDAIPHVQLGPKKTRQVFADCTRVPFAFPAVYVARLGIAHLSGGGTCYLAVCSSQGQFIIMGQRGLYVTPLNRPQDRRSHLQVVMRAAISRVSNPAADVEERLDREAPVLVVKNRKYGYAAESGGAIAIEPEFDDALAFSEGLAAVRVGDADTGRWGYIDTQGRWVMEPQFAYASYFSEGLAAVAVDDYFEGKLGYIDRTGKWVIPPTFEYASPFRRGKAHVKLDGEHGDVDRTGKFSPDRK